MSTAPQSAPDATELAAKLAQREVSSVELTAAYLDRIDALDAGSSGVHAFTHVDRAGALRQAAAADDRRRRGTGTGAIDGLPVAVKASLAVLGWPHTGGYGFRRDQLAATDAFSIARLRAAGAVFLGATNMDEGALGANTVNPWYGTTRNPRSPDHSVGGSSGGSAAAVAANLCACALGSDTIGSLRIPAAWCGIAALKPTFGALSVGGLIPVHHRFDHIGPLARSVRDLGLALDALLAYDPACNVSFPVTLAPAAPAGTRARIGFLVGLDPLEPDPPVIDGYNLAIAALRERGHELVPVDASRWSLTQARRAIFTLCEVEMARRHRDRLASAPESFSAPLRSMLEYGARQTPTDLEVCEQRIAALHALILSSLRSVGVLLMPTTPKLAFRLDGDPSHDSADLTCIASAAGLPAVSVPTRAAAALPVGVQLVGPMGSDRELLRLAGEIEATRGGD